MTPFGRSATWLTVVTLLMMLVGACAQSDESNDIVKPRFSRFLADDDEEQRLLNAFFGVDSDSEESEADDSQGDDEESIVDSQEDNEDSEPTEEDENSNEDADDDSASGEEFDDDSGDNEYMYSDEEFIDSGEGQDEDESLVNTVDERESAFLSALGQARAAGARESKDGRADAIKDSNSDGEDQNDFQDTVEKVVLGIQDASACQGIWCYGLLQANCTAAVFQCLAVFTLLTMLCATYTFRSPSRSIFFMKRTHRLVCLKHLPTGAGSDGHVASKCPNSSECNPYLMILPTNLLKMGLAHHLQSAQAHILPTGGVAVAATHVGVSPSAVPGQVHVSAASATMFTQPQMQAFQMHAQQLPSGYQPMQMTTSGANAGAFPYGSQLGNQGTYGNYV